jgi:hypothetical protein
MTRVSEQLSPGAQTIVDERVAERPDLRIEEGDHERFSHYVPKNKLTEAMVLGTPVVALCGKVWVPSRDPERFPVCPECREIWEGMEAGDDLARQQLFWNRTRASALVRGGSTAQLT